MRRLAFFAAMLPAAMAEAGPPEIVSARAERAGGAWRFDVTVSHADTGWEHYADGWEIVAPDGTRLGYRELLHPHETEQPFTRSLGGVAIPPEVTEVTIRAHDNVHGWGDALSLELGN